jgi:hypothetical protein
VLVEYEIEETIYEPLDMTASDVPVTCAQNEMMNNLLGSIGWKQFKRIAKSEKKLKRMIKQVKLRNYQHAPFWKFGVLVPCNDAQAVELDKANENTKWQDGKATKMGQLLEYTTWIDKGIGGIALNRYKKIWCHMIYNANHDGCNKARHVSSGHLTEPNTESVYS